MRAKCFDGRFLVLLVSTLLVITAAETESMPSVHTAGTKVNCI